MTEQLEVILTWCLCLRPLLCLLLDSATDDIDLAQDGTRQSVYQAKMHLATAVRKIESAEACVGCPGHDRLKSLLRTVEGVLAELKKDRAS